MTVLFALTNAMYFRYFDGVARRLCQEGHRVRVLHGGNKEGCTDRALVQCAADCAGFEFEGRMLGRTGVWRRVLRRSRGLSSYAIYLRPDHPSQWMAERFVQSLPTRLRPWMQSEIGRKLVTRPGTQQLLRKIERRAPPERAILEELRERRPDVVVVCPYIYRPLAPEVEYAKAAMALGIPTVVAVASWDNLTSKETFPLVPDLTLVWNEALAEEATVLHGVPREKIAICGALPFDFWFDMAPSLDRDSFCVRVGLEARKPFIVYLCSSKTVGPAETSFVREFAALLRQSRSIEGVSLLVRPHPFNGEIWRDFRDEGVVVWPASGELPDVEAAQAEYYHSLYFSAGVVGVNTSAFLEAAIVDKPCVTILSERYRQMQSEIGHFRHLLNGGFLEVAHSLPEAAVIVSAILQGQDTKVEGRRQFVRQFIRPGGIDVPASGIAARAIAALADRKALDLATQPSGRAIG